MVGEGPGLLTLQLRLEQADLAVGAREPETILGKQHWHILAERVPARIMLLPEQAQKVAKEKVSRKNVPQKYIDF